ncbi:MAG: hypothetical protein NTW86_05095 [Candidatus Sumerlaeota bacterium]|nr:hypothetical protein [Candidatus Sumerlaeota bacterium]
MTSPSASRRTALLLVDHGSRLAEANRVLEDIAEALRKERRFDYVATAHMDLARPTVAEGLRQCLESGAEEIVVAPCFLVPGRHSAADIPRLVAEATPAGCKPRIAIAEPLGAHRGVIEAVAARAKEALGSECDL